MDPVTTPAAPAAAQEAEAPTGYQITIDVAGDGAISVSSSKAAEGTDPAESASAPAKGIREAMQMAMSIYEGDGTMPEPDTSDSDFETGFGKKNKPPVMQKEAIDPDDM